MPELVVQVCFVQPVVLAALCAPITVPFVWCAPQAHYCHEVR